MGQARHLLSLLALVAILSPVVGGCGSSADDSTERKSGGGAPRSTAPPGATVRACTAAGVTGLRVSGVSCARARKVASGWDGKRICRAPRGASRTSCSVDGFRCLGTSTERGLAVSCAEPGRSLSFLAGRN